MSDLFAVVEFNQASQRPSGVVWFGDTVDEAREQRLAHVNVARAIGRNDAYRVFEMSEIEDEEDWG